MPGSIPNTFIVVRQVDWVYDLANPPSNPPDPTVDVPLVNALVLDVLVMWIDDSNPTMPPPASLVVTQLTPDMVEPGSGNFRPYVGSVRLRTVRANDTVTVTP